MRLIAHLSDLHFGTEISVVVKALTRDLKEARPHVILVSGDITQRARKYQFAQAADFLNQFAAPKLVVPGNHDVPLYNLAHRLINPLAGYHLYFPRDVESHYSDEHLMILGLNSTHRLRIRRGQLSHRQLEFMQNFFHKPHHHQFRIFMSHHPFMPLPRHFPRDLMIRRKKAVGIFEHCKVNVVLGGHSHKVHVDNLQRHYPLLKRPIVMVQAGTAVSRRTFRQPHAYNLIRVSPHQFTVETRTYISGSFVSTARHVFPRND